MQLTPRNLVRPAGAAALLIIVAGAAALAQTSAPAGGPSREVSMVRQDFSDCQNGNVSDQDPSHVGGIAMLLRNADGTTTVRLFITGTPNTTYNVYLKCVRSLGTIRTYDEGEGAAQFSFNTSEPGNVFAFDMYPEGAPAGNKFQSVQVRY